MGNFFSVGTDQAAMLVFAGVAIGVWFLWLAGMLKSSGQPLRLPARPTAPAVAPRAGEPRPTQSLVEERRLADAMMLNRKQQLELELQLLATTLPAKP